MTCSTRCGSRTCSCAGWRLRRSGPCSAPLKPRDCASSVVHLLHLLLHSSFISASAPARSDRFLQIRFSRRRIRSPLPQARATFHPQRALALTVQPPNVIMDVTLCRYEAEGKARKTILARDLWFQILESQIETGTPYLLYKVTLCASTGNSFINDRMPCRTPLTPRATRKTSAQSSRPIYAPKSSSTPSLALLLPSTSLTSRPDTAAPTRLPCATSRRSTSRSSSFAKRLLVLARISTSSAWCRPSTLPT